MEWNINLLRYPTTIPNIGNEQKHRLDTAHKKKYLLLFIWLCIFCHYCHRFNYPDAAS